MTSSLIDSLYFGDTFGNPAMRHVFSDESRFRSWLDVEAAVARTQARLGLIPVGAAEEISRAAVIERLDLAAMKEEYERVGFPILPLVHQLAKACSPESARWVHWGATTQDIVDTGLVLQMRDGFGMIEPQIDEVIGAVARLARDHRDTVMAGRTFQQQAAPITFGFKAAVWLDELIRHRERLSEIKRRALVCQFGGAVGTLATLGQDGHAVLDALARELGLETPSISWHTARDGWAEAIFWLAMVGATLAKIATEIATLMRTEVDEVREPFAPGRGGSSTLPQKRNPIACPIIIAIGNRLRECVGTQLTAMIQEHERSVAGQPLEWLVIPDAFVLTSGALKQAFGILDRLTVDAERMRANLDSGGGFLMAEAVMMGLAPHTGRNQAHDIVYAAASRAMEAGDTLRSALRADPLVTAHLSASQIDALLEPANYTGSAGAMVDAVLAQVERR
ncbi:class-II fumarase/aspartase family protein [Thiocapsa rosea]|uniref:3-carboxy-cis,cis-muconate cycloisomerase n=1 Tax=Thiocapsa rosea TaxID=69360 RepID=A0A495V839_9GAMM|nr:adenylosuccinate lyase family protein [Thiocapsa rosea]RKT45556.1 3-carboxy-cis,cis-muconate cycloisomerase [Thiocapsa rosea]